jgi:hypothetical protein
MKKLNLIYLILGVIFFLNFSGCGGGGGSADSSSATGALGASSNINTNGGVVEVKNPNSRIYGTRVDIPPGALNIDTLITIEEAQVHPETPIPLSLAPAGLKISFQPDGIKFNKPIYITIPYLDDNDDGIVDGTNTSENEIYALSFDDESKQWLYVLKVSQNTQDKNITIISDHFCTYTSAVEKASIFGNSGAVIFTIDGLEFKKVLNSELFGIPNETYTDHRPSYLKDALINNFDLALVDRDVYSYGCDPELSGCDTNSSWYGDSELTPQLIHGSDKLNKSLKKMLESEYYKSKSILQPNSTAVKKNFVLITHSWGTVLGYLGLEYCQRNYKSELDVEPDLVITLSTPIGSIFNNISSPGCAKFFGLINASDVAIKINEYTIDKVNQTHLYSSAYNNKPRFKRWVNYYSEGDIISGPIKTLLSDAEDNNFNIKLLCPNYRTTRENHAISSLSDKIWGEELSVDDINNIATPFRNEIENILKSYIQYNINGSWSISQTALNTCSDNYFFETGVYHPYDVSDSVNNIKITDPDGNVYTGRRNINKITWSYLSNYAYKGVFWSVSVDFIITSNTEAFGKATATWGDGNKSCYSIAEIKAQKN